MTTTKRTRLAPGQRRAQLIELGLALLREKPIEDISVEDIAAQAGVSKGLLFHYFGSKNEYQAALVQAVTHQLLDATEPDYSQTPLRALEAALDSYISFVEQAPNLYISMLRGALSSIPDMVASVEASRASIAVRILALVTSLGIDDTIALRVSIRGWIALVEEAVIDWLTKREIERGELIELLTGALIGVILGPMLAREGTRTHLFPEFNRPIAETLGPTPEDRAG
ncbi:TetR/AcrR family transcriptional regulator [Hoyosella sp. G463]|uniref:TetR/AcrR family transcriptional regulator n=1 Tax=Lolliginicoccus lacisalsi TaxID=2742202 RepID=A0A927PN63_9ACTN|nr:TetR/AcrR family transcriptional regulator [Lolliginicoccus lacisalsi]MBD8507799.1 TetR/AcrR family transcriptional regulator [Lolliginicoccus lacisalsi]